MKRMNDKGILIIVSGFAGSGKGTIMKKLVQLEGRYALSISATTRAPRAGETHGKEYFFKSVLEFEELIKQDKLLEYARYVNNYYGTPKQYVDEQLERGKDVILEIEIQGALHVKEKYPDAILVFVMPPSASELKKRLIGRGTETDHVIAERLKRAYEESHELENYDYLIVNEKIEESVLTLHHMIESEHKKTARNINIINKIREELKSL